MRVLFRCHFIKDPEKLDARVLFIKEEIPMNIPLELLYSRTHEWVRVLKDGTAEVGLTDHAQDALGDLVFVNLPRAGESVLAGQPFGDVESVKAVSDVYSPVTGIITAVNEALADQPEMINKAAYDAWLIRVRLNGKIPELLDSDAYARVIRDGED
jgi:glycine cleavage system H protein